MLQTASPQSKLEELSQLRHAMEETKIICEAARKEYDRVFQKMKTRTVTFPDWNARNATRAYASCLTDYKDATIAFNRYLVAKAFGAKARAAGA